MNFEWAARRGETDCWICAAPFHEIGINPQRVIKNFEL